jgi:hypothetical protein
MSKPSYSQLVILLIPAAFLAAYLSAGPLLLRVGLELPLWLKVWWSAYIASMLHVPTMGLAGTFLGVPIVQMSFGFGWRWFEIRIAAIPISFRFPVPGGWVKFAGRERHDGLVDVPNPKLLGWQGCVMELSGCAVLLALAALILGRASFDVLAVWRQYIEGALSPFSHAQVLLTDLGRYLGGLDDVSIFAVVCFGTAALCLFPLPGLNGGNAFMYFVSSTLYPLTPRTRERLSMAGSFTLLFASGSWLLALLFLAHGSWFPVTAAPLGHGGAP